MIIPGRGEWVALMVLGMILSGTIAFEIAGPEAQPSFAPANIVIPVRDVQPNVVQPPDQHGAWLSEILARPLFSPERRPVGIVSDVRGLPRLTGIIVSDSRRIAIFASASGDHPIVGEVGTRIGVYEVQAVDDSGVTVLGPGGTSVIRPLFDSGPPPAKRTPPPPIPVPPRAQAK
jgi:general secretion pathway protein N